MLRLDLGLKYTKICITRFENLVYLQFLLGVMPLDINCFVCNLIFGDFQEGCKPYLLLLGRLK